LAYTTNLFGTLTHFASGQAAAYFGAGYLPVPSIFYIGFISGIWNLAIWLFLGVGWMKVVKFW
jgi:DASS family divalent anion:Na+ symporter